MITQSSQKVSLADFLQFPETEPASEYLHGEIEQKPMPKGKHSRIQTSLASVINKVGEPQKLACAFTELRCTFGDASLVPDITVFEWARIPKDEKGQIADRFEIAPDWTIEILSPEQSASRVIKKITFCLNNGTKLGWFVDPGDECVTIFAPDHTPVVKSGDEILTALEILGDW